MTVPTLKVSLMENWTSRHMQHFQRQKPGLPIVGEISLVIGSSNPSDPALIDRHNPPGEVCPLLPKEAVKWD